VSSRPSHAGFQFRHGRQAASRTPAPRSRVQRAIDSAPATIRTWSEFRELEVHTGSRMSCQRLPVRVLLDGSRRDGFLRLEEGSPPHSPCLWTAHLIGKAILLPMRCASPGVTRPCRRNANLRGVGGAHAHRVRLRATAALALHGARDDQRLFHALGHRVFARRQIPSACQPW